MRGLDVLSVTVPSFPGSQSLIFAVDGVPSCRRSEPRSKPNASLCRFQCTYNALIIHKLKWTNFS